MRYICLTIHKKHAQQENAHKFLPVLSAMHKSHSGSADNLGILEYGICFFPVHFPANLFNTLDNEKAKRKTHQNR